jgi:alkanesulfonate monooxygenase SsuD/methylene tetrahydromethanopterin reductase-like flavin-dependent oxidoreductase (luciferase family)
MLDEYVDVVSSLVRGEAVTSHRDGWSIDAVTISPRPRQAHLPLWLSGHASGALRRAALRGDGWIGSGMVGLAQMRDAVNQLMQHRQASGKPGSFAIAKRVYIHLPEACSAASTSLSGWSRAIFGRDRDDLDFVVRGSAAECVAAISALVDTGITDVILDPVYHETEHVRAVLSSVLALAADD